MTRGRGFWPRVFRGLGFRAEEPMFALGAVQVPTGAVHCSMAEGFSGFLRHSDALGDSEHGVFRVVSFRLRSSGI